MDLQPEQFKIYWCDLEPTFGHQMKKTRPCVIVSPNEMNGVLGAVVIVPLTSTVRKFPFYVPIQYNDHTSALACDQIKTIDKRRIGKKYATLTKKDTAKLSDTLCTMFQV
ncbi:type II toxin-antitoxin system PemK/MazF family toxin [soil metagenome]